MNKQQKKIIGLFARYLTILLIGAGNLYIIYKILMPLTTQILNAILSIFTDTMLYGNIIHLHEIGIAAEIVPACVVGSAFYLLFLLIMSTPNIKPETRTKAIITAFALLFALNILRILLLVPIATTTYFETVHWIFWHLISIIFVIGIWFSIVKIYNIKKVPIYSDVKYIRSLIKTKNTKRKKKHK